MCVAHGRGGVDVEDGARDGGEVLSRQMKKVLGLENNPAISRFSSLPASGGDVIDARRFPPSKFG